MSEIKPLTSVSGCNLGVLISEHGKIIGNNFLCRKFLLGIFLHPKNKGCHKPHYLWCGTLLFF